MTIPTEVLTGFSSLALAVTSAAAAYLTRWLRGRVSAEHLATAVACAQITVKAIEQVGQVAGWSGAQKHVEAIDRVQALAAAHGVRLPLAQWTDLLEQAILDLNQGQATPAPVAPGAVNVAKAPAS